MILKATLAALLAACIALAAPAHAATTFVPQPDGAAYSLPNTKVHSLHAKELGRDYQVFISLPPGYPADGPKLPVVFVTDADYAFPLVRAIFARIGGHSDAIAPFILVGLSYAAGDTPEFSRRRDYTPSVNPEQGLKSDMPGRQPAWGEAEGYRRFLASDVLPLVASHYRADMGRSVFVGHSYGSLLGTHILLSSPEMFSKYVLSSPSLWFDHRLMFAREKDYAAAHRDLKAEVFFSAGGYEAVKPGPRYNTETDMVRDLRDFAAALKARRYPGLKTQIQVFEGHDHLTVFPDMITSALKWAVPGGR